MADKALIMTVPCQKAFSARRFVNQLITITGFRTSSPKPKNGFISPEFCFVGLAARNRTGLRMEDAGAPQLVQKPCENKGSGRAEPAPLARSFGPR
jgi:hypothetical protein